MRPSISSVGVTDLTSGGSDQLASLEGFIDTVEIGAAEAEADAPRRDWLTMASMLTQLLRHGERLRSQVVSSSVWLPQLVYGTRAR